MSDRKRLAHLIKPTNQRTVIIDMVKANGWTRGAEIGVLRGKTLFSVLDACPGLSMIGVDQWQVIPLREDENAETYVDFDMRALERDVTQRAMGYGERCIILKGDSVAMAKEVERGSLDFIFLDGDHTEKGLKRDIAAWASKVRSGGMILGHDISWTTVNRVVSAKYPGFEEFGEEVWGIVKP